MDIATVKQEMETAAEAAGSKYFQTVLGGVDRFACGFAWIEIYPEHRGNTRLGRAERKLFEALGARKSWHGRCYEIWMPGRQACQNVDVHESAARAGAEVLRRHGFKAYSGSRLD